MTSPAIDIYARPLFPTDCPIEPLGYLACSTEGPDRFYFRNFQNKIVGLRDFGKLGLIALFGPYSGWLDINFPRWERPVYSGRGDDRQLVRAGRVVSFDQPEAARALIEECMRKGPFSFNPASSAEAVAAKCCPHCGAKQ